MMHYREGTPVMTADGHRVGDVARVVIDPRTREVTHVVVREGFLFSEDRLLPTELVATTTDDEIHLHQNRDDLPELLPLAEQHFVPADDEDEAIAAPGMAVPLYGYPPAGVGWWGMDFAPYWPAPPVAIHTESNLPKGSILLNQGARVSTADGDHVGDVDEIITDNSGAATHVVIAAGWLFKSRKLIPTGWIQAVRNGEVRLSVRARVLERLPDYEG